MSSKKTNQVPMIFKIKTESNTNYLAHSDVIAYMVKIHHYGPREIIEFIE